MKKIKPRAQAALYNRIARELSNADIASRLFTGVFPAGLSYADRGIEEHGDYARVAFLDYRTLELSIYKPQSPLLPVIKSDAARIQAMRGQQFQVSTCGQTVTLGGEE